MDKIEKVLQHLSAVERKIAREILNALQNNNFDKLDIRKLKGYANIFRARKGKIRVIYTLRPNGDIIVLKIERRSDTTYNF